MVATCASHLISIGSVNEYLSLLLTFLGIHGHATSLPLPCPSLLSRDISSSVACCESAECLNLLQTAIVAQLPPKAAHGPMNSLTNHDSLYFPIQESPAGGQAAFLQPACPPCGKDSLFAFFPWTFNSSVQILADFWPEMFRESPFPKRQGEREQRICSRVRRWLTARLCPGAQTQSSW